MLGLKRPLKLLPQTDVSPAPSTEASTGLGVAAIIAATLDVFMECSDDINALIACSVLICFSNAVLFLPASSNCMLSSFTFFSFAVSEMFLPLICLSLSSCSEI